MAGKLTLFALLALIAIDGVRNSGINGSTDRPSFAQGSLFSRGSGFSPRYSQTRSSFISGLGSHGSLSSSRGSESSSSSGHLPSTTYHAQDIDKVVEDIQRRGVLDRCKSIPHDFVLVVDESGSITQDHWVGEVLDFVKVIAKTLESCNRANKLSIVEFAKKPKLIMDLTSFNEANLTHIYNAIQDMFFLGRRTFGATYTGAALKFVREKVLDKNRQFTVEITESSTPKSKREQVIILLTDGAANDYSVAAKESLIARFNGVHFLVFGIGVVNNLECRKLVGCPQSGVCDDFIKANWGNLFHHITELFKRACDTSRRNAVCLEKWDNYRECSKSCGGGIQYARFLQAVTLSEPTTGVYGTTGFNCQRQYEGISNKFRSCNTHPCVDTVPTEIQRHVQGSHSLPESLGSESRGTSALNTLLGTTEYGSTASETYSDSLFSDHEGSLNEGHSELGSSDEHFDLGGSVESEHAELESEEGDRLHNFDDHYDEEEEEHDENEDDQEDLEEEEEEDAEHEDSDLVQSESPDSLEGEVAETEEDSEESEEEASDESKYSYTRFIGGNRLRVVAVAATVVVLTAISITAFSYLFLKGKGKAPLMPDPSDLEFMNAGDGDDVEPSENFQVSNVDDGIWA